MDETATNASPLSLIWSLQRLELASGETSYPARVLRSHDGFYSSLERAESVLRKGVEKAIEMEKEDGVSYLALRYDIVAYQVDADRQCYRIRRYDGDGTFRYEVHQMVEKQWPDFHGVRPEECSFQVGDLVELIVNDYLVVGIVAAQPPTPEYVAQHPCLFNDGAEDVYFVLFEELYDHDHPDDGELMRPRFAVPAEVEKRLRYHLEPFLKG